MTSYVPVAEAMEKAQREGYEKVVCGGFSAGCDMLLRSVLFAPARCDLLLLQSPWLPVLKDHGEALVKAVRQKGIALKIFCGACDEDCLPMAKRLYEITDREGLSAELAVQEGSRHQFPKEPFVLNYR